MQEQYTTDRREMQVRYICDRCGAHLDPGERCDCDQYEQPEVEMARIPQKKHTIDRETFFDAEAAQRYRRWLLS